MSRDSGLVTYCVVGTWRASEVVKKGFSGGRNGSRIDVHDIEQGFMACHSLC